MKAIGHYVDIKAQNKLMPITKQWMFMLDWTQSYG